MELSEGDNSQPIDIGSCGYAHFEESPETAEEASRRVEHAGSTPPSTPARDSEIVINEAAENIYDEDSTVSYHPPDSDSARGDGAGVD